MTLIYSHINPLFVLQVADGNLTDTSGNVTTNKFSKSVIVGNAVALAFTGWSHLDNNPFERWVVEQLKAAPDDLDTLGLFKYLAGRVEQALARSVPGTRYALAAAGWTTAREGEPKAYFTQRISNFHDDDGNELDSPLPKMGGSGHILNYEPGSTSPDAGYFLAVGSIPTENELDVQQIRADALGRSDLTETAAANRLIDQAVDAIRREAEIRADDVVGGRISVICIPRDASDRSDAPIRSRYDPRYISSYYVLEDGSKNVDHPLVIEWGAERDDDALWRRIRLPA